MWINQDRFQPKAAVLQTVAIARVVRDGASESGPIPIIERFWVTAVGLLMKSIVV
jgi:hypothetical protein